MTTLFDHLPHIDGRHLLMIVLGLLAVAWYVSHTRGPVGVDRRAVAEERKR